MAKKERKCLCDGTLYTYCPDCNGADRLKPTWYSEFCCETCKDLWDTAVKFNMGAYTKAEAKAIISALELKPAEQYVACIQRDLKNIMHEEPKAEPKPKRGKRAAMTIIDEAIKPEIKEEIKLPEPVVESTAIEEIAPVAEVSSEVVNQTEEIK